MCVCVCVCMYGCTYAHMHVCTHACMCVRTCLLIDLSINIFISYKIYLFMHVPACTNFTRNRDTKAVTHCGLGDRSESSETRQCHPQPHLLYVLNWTLIWLRHSLMALILHWMQRPITNLADLTRSYQILPNPTRSYQILLDPTRSYQILPDPTRLYQPIRTNLCPWLWLRSPGPCKPSPKPSPELHATRSVHQRCGLWRC